MVKPAAGKLVLISDSRRDAAWVERSGHAPALVVHSNDDMPAATVPIAPPPDSDARLDGKLPRDAHVTRAFALSIGAHLVFAAAIFWLMPGAPAAPPLVTVEMVFAKVESDVVVEAQGKPVPEQVAETQAVEAPPPVALSPEPEPPPPVAEVPPEPEPPPPPEPDPIPEIVKAPEPPPPEVKVEKPPEPKVEPRPRPPRPKPIKLTEPRPVPVVVPPTEMVREDAMPSKIDAGQLTKTSEVAAAPTVNENKMPQEAAAPVINTTPTISVLKFRNNAKPPYPARARDMNIEGTVLLEVWIDVEGNPTDVIVIESSGSSLLDEAARRGAMRWTFWPYTVDGRASPGRAHVPVPFKLK